MARARAHLSARTKRLVAGAAVGGVVGLLAAVVAYTRPVVVDRAEQWTYDLRARRAAHRAQASKDIVLVGIDESDIENVEAAYDLVWPWPRELFGELVRTLSAQGARAVVLDWLFQDVGPKGLDDAVELAKALRESGKAVLGVVASTPRGATPAPPVGDWAVSMGRLPSRAAAVEAAVLLLAWKARVFVGPPAADGRVELLVGGKPTLDEAAAVRRRLAAMESVRLEEGPRPAGAPRRLSQAERSGEVTVADVAARRSGLAILPGEGGMVPSRVLEPPFALFADAPARLGNVMQPSEPDGVLRRHQPLVSASGAVYPSLALAGFLVAHPEVTPRLERGALVLGPRRIPLDEEGRFVVRFHGGEGTYQREHAYEVLRSAALVMEGKPPSLPASTFAGKIVVVVPEAYALRDLRVTPISNVQLGGEINANAIDDLEAARVVVRASRATDAALTLAVATALSIALMLSWTSARSLVAGLGLTAVVLGATVAGSTVGAAWLLDARDLWIGLAVPIGGAVAAALTAILATTALERRDRRFVQEALGRYTSGALVAELIAHPEYLSLEWGTRRAVSVYFSDIAGFTSFSEALEPERLVALLNDYLTSMTDIVLAHGGIVDKYIGDAIMAFWGAPLDAPDHARRAALCAIAMRRRCEELRGKWQAEYGHVVIARAGVNSGEAVVGNMGSKHKYNYTVMGDMVNLASRLEGANKAYDTTLMVSESTYALVKEDVEARELDLLAVKGKSKPVTVYELLGERGTVAPELAVVYRRYEEALGLYRRQQFAAALGAFERTLEVHPDDGPSRTYVERCRYFLTNPPGADWDGVWHMKEK